MTMIKFRLIGGVVLSLVGLSAFADPPTYEISIRNHRFEPAEVRVPANTKVKLVIKNMDPTPEEFESYELNREKVIAGNAVGVVFVGPLAAGRYPFFGEFNAASAQGALIVE